MLEAYNGSEMLRLAATQEVHLILLDVMMPGMDGLSAMAELRRT
ncbi:MAG: response regulator, partial [Oscillospiraceae bacterium]